MNEVKVMDRRPYEEAVVNLLSNKNMAKLSFYGYILAKCKVVLDERLPTLGVTFEETHYKLVVGKQFNDWSLNERIAVLIHESKHILGGHIFRKGERDHQLFNIAADIAINQTIANLPEMALFPATFDFPSNLNAELYYNLLIEEKKKQEQEKKEYQDKQDNQDNQDGEGGKGEEKEEDEGEGEGGGTGQGSSWPGPSNGHPNITNISEEEQVTLDDHGQWNSVDNINEDLAKSITENMIDDAIAKSRGNTPSDLEEILKLWRRKAKISWKKELRSILASKTGKRISTIKRRDRRFPRRADLRGNKRHTDRHEIVVGVDTSGSMSDSEIFDGLVEIFEITKVNGNDLKVIQIDTDIKSIEEFGQKTKEFKRRGYGGTFMGAIVPFIKKENLKPDVLIMISDMYIEEVPQTAEWDNFKTRTIWLSTSGEIPKWSTSTKGHKVIDIKNR